MKQKDSLLGVSAAVALAVTVLSAASAQGADWRWSAKFNSGGTSVAASYGQTATPWRGTATLPPAPKLPAAPKLPPPTVLPQSGTSARSGVTFSLFMLGSSVFWNFSFGF